MLLLLQALGHLVRNSGQSMSDIVERQVRSHVTLCECNSR
jgi:hypothetical protein